MDLNLPEKFIQTIQSTFGEDGFQFIADLPKLIDEASRRWELYDIQPVANLSYNFVAFAKSTNENVILKIGVPNPELTSEMAALKLFNGDGACCLMECDEARGFLLLERLIPGIMLSELIDDDQRTEIAIDVMQKLWRPLESISLLMDNGQHPLGKRTVRFQKFIKLTSWFDALNKIRPQFNGGTGPFPNKILERVESVLPELFADQNTKLIHGDFHHYNILLSDRGWLAIDPKGVIGPAGYEIGPLMLNPWNSILDRISFKAQTERRVRIISERMNWEREMILNWSMAHAILSAWWDFQDGMDWKSSLWRAEVFSEIT